MLAAKRYRAGERSDFHRSTIYTEGRSTRRSRDARAMARRTGYGRSFAASQWASAEFDALCRLVELGVPVPYPVQVLGTELLMEFVGTGRVAAPRLAETRLRGPELRPMLEQLTDAMHRLAGAGLAHGDLSPYNLLVDGDRLVIIDLPQLVDVISNPSGMDLLHRDCVNVCTWFTRHGLECDAEELFAELVGVLAW
ncbi:serine protein kinase RIO [Agromyces archimandritae]|uniref:serine protein kinase RIO n=1 Tax=Agromyces archimandritae TaxID=2781962 RepID=UPI001FD2E164|nr:RIO1 family regulatory kinase/ATPase [Agromyces archimandritae]